MANYHRQILALTDDELEYFTRDWIAARCRSFFEVVSFSGSGDLGRDVVAFLTPQRHEGEWHNYQCKQYRNNLPTGVALLEIGKILYYSFSGAFNAPIKYYFVAPKGINRVLDKLIFRPNDFKEKLIADWDVCCSEKLIEGQCIPMDAKLKTFIQAYNFSNIGRITLTEMLADKDITPVLFKWFGEDPGPAPHGSVPEAIHNVEQIYISELLHAYSERKSALISSLNELDAHPSLKEHLKNQRIRFYDADAFKRFYRDNTAPEHITSFEKEIYHGIVDKCDADYKDSLERVGAVMSQAAALQTTGILSKHTQTTVKQGICHHFVNEGKITWKK